MATNREAKQSLGLGRRVPEIPCSPGAEIRVSIFVLSGFWQPRREAGGLACDDWDINTPLMRGSRPQIGRGCVPPTFKHFEVQRSEIHEQQECFALLIIVKSSYKGWYVNKDIYQNSDRYHSYEKPVTDWLTWQWWSELQWFYCKRTTGNEKHSWILTWKYLWGRRRCRNSCKEASTR